MARRQPGSSFAGQQSGIHCLDFAAVKLVDDRPANLERVGKLSGFHAESLGEQGETLDLLKRGKILLQLVDALLNHLDNIGIFHQVLNAPILNLVLRGIFL